MSGVIEWRLLVLLVIVIISVNSNRVIKPQRPAIPTANGPLDKSSPVACYWPMLCFFQQSQSISFACHSVPWSYQQVGGPKKPEGNLQFRSSEVTNCRSGFRKCDNSNKCIRSDFWCDWDIDCPDLSDELHCSCKDRTNRHQHCDGYFDCPDAEDERGCFGCGNDSFSCFDWFRRNPKGSCYLSSQKCDGERQCSNGRDEIDCHLLNEDFNRNDSEIMTGHTSGYLFKNWRGIWYPVCQSIEAWAIEACRGEVGLLRTYPEVTNVPVSRGLGPFLSITESKKIELVQECNDQAAFVKCPSITCGTVVISPNEFLPYEDSVDPPFLFNQARGSTVSEAADQLQGFSFAPRISAGRIARPLFSPFVVSIHIDGSIQCSGTIINENWILTAAHAVHRPYRSYYEITAGTPRSTSLPPSIQMRKAKFIIFHPQYDNSTSENDLALIKLNEPLNFSRWIRPLCLPMPLWGDVPKIDEICTTVGWGQIDEKGPMVNDLVEVEVQIAAECSNKKYVSNGTICTGGHGDERGACRGDSGGPLICRIPHSYDWYVAGINSHGEGCGRRNESSNFVRIGHYYQWITENINLNHQQSSALKPLDECPRFQCPGKTGRCQWQNNTRCDGRVHCSDAADEIDCPPILSYKR